MRNDTPADAAFVSLEEYLRFENASPTRHEYVAGRVYAMSGTRARHNLIVTNIFSRLRAAATGSCRAYVIDLKVRVGRDRVYYPDAVVMCTPHTGDTLIFDDPCLVVEVTSRSSRRIDHGEKLDAYRSLSSLRGYLIAEHDRRRVALHTRRPTGEWTRDDVLSSGRLAIPCPATSLSLDEIYDGVELPPLRVGEALDEEDTWVEELDYSNIDEE